MEPSFEGYVYIRGGAVMDAGFVAGTTTTRIEMESGSRFGPHSTVTVEHGAALNAVTTYGTVLRIEGGFVVLGTFGDNGTGARCHFAGPSLVNEGMITADSVTFCRSGAQSVSGVGKWSGSSVLVATGSTTTLASDVTLGDSLVMGPVLTVTGTLDPGGHTLTLMNSTLSLGMQGSPASPGMLSGSGQVRTRRNNQVWQIAGTLDVPLSVASSGGTTTVLEGGTPMGANTTLTVESGATLELKHGPVVTLGDVVVLGTITSTQPGLTFEFQGNAFINEGVSSVPIVRFTRPGAQSIGGAGKWFGSAMQVVTGSTTTLASDVAFGDSLVMGPLLNVTGTLDPGGHTLILINTTLWLGRPGLYGSPDTAGTVSGSGLVRTRRNGQVWLTVGTFDVPLSVASFGGTTTILEGGTPMGANATLTVENGATLDLHFGPVITLGNVVVLGTMSSTWSGMTFEFRGASLVNAGEITIPRLVFGRSGSQSAGGSGTWNARVDVAAGSSTSLATDMLVGHGAPAEVTISGVLDLGSTR